MSNTTVAPSTPSHNPKPKWYRRTWVLVALGLLLGIGFGAAGSSTDVTTTAEYKDQVSKVEDAESALAEAEAELESTQDELATVAGDLPAREEAVTQAEEALDVREVEVQTAEKAVEEREKAVGATETRIANNTVPGDGIFRVGTDIKAGTYRTAGAPDCYYGVNGDANGDNIISNNITSGPAVVQVSPGQFFETSSCAEWVLQ